MLGLRPFTYICSHSFFAVLPPTSLSFPPSLHCLFFFSFSPSLSPSSLRAEGVHTEELDNDLGRPPAAWETLLLALTQSLCSYLYALYTAASVGDAQPPYSCHCYGAVFVVHLMKWLPFCWVVVRIWLNSYSTLLSTSRTLLS